MSGPLTKVEDDEDGREKGRKVPIDPESHLESMDARLYGEVGRATTCRQLSRVSRRRKG
jgi:hypothetical protein